MFPFEKTARRQIDGSYVLNGVEVAVDEVTVADDGPVTYRGQVFAIPPIYCTTSTAADAPNDHYRPGQSGCETSTGSGTP